MRDALIIFVAIILAIAIGGYLFMNGGPTFNPERVPPIVSEPDASFMVLADGQNSGQVDRRTNFRITNDEELGELWFLLYGQSGAGVPRVDFTKYEVIAVFDGTHSSGGYAVHVRDVIDGDGMRTIYIEREEPGENCVVTDAITSPFQVVRVLKSPYALTKQETIVTRDCL